jgi:hypothetical protein
MVGVLSISGNISTDCDEVIYLMKKLGINGDVTCNKTILDGNVENGCRIRIASSYMEHTKLLWKTIQENLGLTCAHVNISESKDGCVFDVFRESLCPGK